MKIYQYTGLFFFLIISNEIAAQQTTFLKLNQASIQPFITQGLSHQTTKDDFQELTNGNNELSQDLLTLIDSQNNYSYGWNGPTNFGLNANVGILIRSKDKKEYRDNVFLRAGIQFHSKTVSSNSATLTNRKRIDTLTANSNGSITYVDSTERETVLFAKKAELFNVDAALIFHTNRTQKWSIFGGMGVSFGASINSYAEINYIHEASYELTGSYEAISNNYFTSFLNSKYSRIKNKTNIAGIVYLPMGVDVRLGDQKEFWKRLHLFYEFRPSIIVHNTPEVGTITAFTLSHGIGLNVRF